MAQHKFTIVAKTANGTFLLPPGHVDYAYSVTEKYSNGREVMSGTSLATVLGDEDVPWSVKARARSLIKEAKPVESELWVRSLYAYLRNMYLNPDLTVEENKGASTLVSASELTEGDRDPQRHGAVLFIREFFPDHEVRMDLIADPGKGWGSYPCDKCGEHVQYEGRLDALAVVKTRMDGQGMTHWSYSADCSKGGAHTLAE